MSWSERLQYRFSSFVRRVCFCQKEETPESAEYDPGEIPDGDLEGGGGRRPSASAPQYRLEATSKNQRRGICGSILSVCYGSAATSAAGGMGVNSNQRLAVYLHWMFRVNFIFLFAVMCTIFFVLVMLFACIIIGAGRMDEDCVRIGGAEFDQAGSPFADAFALSWTTFSTVGYGSTYPALGHENDNPTNCLFITVVCSLESFLGVLYSGFCGAILFGKVLRIQSHAQVLFSDPIVIRYGSALAQTDMTEPESDDDEDDEEKKKLPCPVLEFRVINRLFNEVGGEIMDATLNVVANVDANDADPSLRDALDSERQRFARNQQENHHRGDSDSITDQFSQSDSGSTRSGSLRHRIFAPLDHILNKRDHQQIEEDPTARLVNKRIFSKMLIEASDHPFFKRVWLARHVLDETSPILKPRVRRQIRRNGGYWPEKLNGWQAIRESLQFNQILVSLNGVSNVSASDVYAQKIYDFVDINVGYQFVNLLYRDTDGALKVDTDLINDVREQSGGGGEPLISED